MSFSRASGILLHPASLSGPLGIGDIGLSARAFVDQLAAAGQRYWQILPLGPTGYGDSPYQSFSAFAGNPLLISPDELVADHLILGDDAGAAAVNDPTRIDYGAVIAHKARLLEIAFGAFKTGKAASLVEKFASFCRVNGFWLDDYALYRVIKASQGQKPWYEWTLELRLRDGGALQKIADDLADELLRERFTQFLFFLQWDRLKAHARESGVEIIGDLPLFVALDSADVWCNQDKFKLAGDGKPLVVAGVPPDYFSKTGQLWGNPIYDWDAMREDGFEWWVARVHASLEMVDVVRFDHFRGFAAVWEVPGKDKTAENGEWVDAPGKELFQKIVRDLGNVPGIAEDLGVITPDVIELREQTGLPGMRILEYGFGGDASNGDLPHNYVRNCVAYTGTHDNDTVVGWFASLDKKTRQHCLEYLASDGREISWDMLRAVWSSPADIAIAPMQDILGLGSDARMNRPASTGGNWNWRMSEPLSPETAERLRKLTDLYGRVRSGIAGEE